jgi:outer membrane lipoprotein-sorting protein
MKKIIYYFTAFALTLSVSAQDVDEIINTYFENTGGYAQWGQLKGLKVNAKMNQQGMEFPMQIVQLSDGRQYTQFEVQGQVLKQGVFDGETVWSINFQSMKAEEADAETIANAKLDANDFPDELYDYKTKGYTVELIGTETMDGAETYKVKLEKEKKMVDGEEVDDITYYYFETESMVPIAQESEIKQGPMKGSTVVVTMSDYQEVDGFYFPFSMTQGVKGGPSQPLMIESIEVNPEVDDSEFSFPNQ